MQWTLPESTMVSTYTTRRNNSNTMKQNQQNLTQPLTPTKQVAIISRLQGKMLNCCFVNFKKAFDNVPRCELWKRMMEIGMPLNYNKRSMFIWTSRCQLKMDWSFSKYLLSKMGVKQGCPLSHYLFSLYALINLKK